MNIKRNFSKLIILIPTIIVCIVDLIITTIYQYPEYWNNDLSVANEGNPVLYFAMSNHVAGLFIATFLWLLLISCICFFVPKIVTKFIALAVLIGNTWGISSWISGDYKFWLIMLLIIVNSLMFIIFDTLQDRIMMKYNTTN
jgi:magnesium-transporting ATPase (P-type)